ncbi:MAG: putative toxin-antitoxin system toxin component, PIN family [Bacteroidales bacterium]|jgi:putative PIN family toxin of toxin-antitoxin system|nr:putative toxin-antitoxin system toxin component, PIN family [Bacteroidales bacterium]
MKLDLDSNIFVSAFFWGGHPRKIMERIIKGIDDLFISKDILQEVSSVMVRPKFGVEQEYVNHFIQSIEELSHLLYPKGLVKGVCRDKKDDKILECALIATADYLITGDNDLLVLKSFEGTQIITPNDYLSLITDLA